MAELIIIACLLASPEHCEEFRVPFLEQMNIVQCIWQSQIFAAEWTAEHPGWVLRKVKCGLPRA